MEHDGIGNSLLSCLYLRDIPLKQTQKQKNLTFPLDIPTLTFYIMTMDQRLVTIETETVRCEKEGHSVIYHIETNSLYFAKNFWAILAE
jgi:hypothetical protein